MMKLCSKCKTKKDDSQFYKYRTRSLQSYCNDCNKKYRRDYYLKNKKRFFLKNDKRRTIRKDFVNSLKDGTPCADCKVAYPPYMMEFDHLRDKKFGIFAATRRHSLEKIKKEIEKCEIVCANCHKRRTYNRRHGLII